MMCRGCHNADVRKYCQKNRDKRIAAGREYYQENRDKRREYRQKNRDKCIATAKRYWADHPERARELRKTWEAKHPEHYRAHSAARRAIKAHCPVGDRNAVAAFYKRVHDAPRMRCYWCHKWVKKAARVVDHIIPLRPRAGQPRGSHVAANLCCSCASCNGSKGNRPPEDVSGQLELGIT